MKAIHHTDNNNIKYKIYALLEKNGTVYVGKTTSLYMRMASHAHHRSMSINSLVYRAIEVNTELQARKIEAFLIQEFREVLSNKYGVNIHVRHSEDCIKKLKASSFFNSIMNHAQMMSNILKHAKNNSCRNVKTRRRAIKRKRGRPPGRLQPLYMRA